MPVYTVSLTDGTTLANLAVAAGRGPKGDGFTGVTYNTATGRFVFTSNDGLGFTSDDITVDLDAAVVAAQAARDAAQAAQSATENIFDQFGDQYLGPKASDPTVDNDGDPLTEGDIYFNTTDDVLKFYSGTAWVAPEVVATTAANNASNSASAASSSATSAANSASAALTSEQNADTSETNAANSAAAALVSEQNAASSAASINPNSIDINGGTIDGTVIGGSTPAAISGTTGQFGTSLNVDGTVTANGADLNGAVVINEAGAEVDFRVESDTFTHALFVEGEGSSNRLKLGIGTGTITNPYGQPNFTDLNINGIWGGVISFKLNGAEKGFIGQRNSGNEGMVVGSSSGQNLRFVTGSNNTRVLIDNNGDISFFEDTGTTPKFFWDSSTERLGIGTANPSATLAISSSDPKVILSDSDAASVTDTTGAFEFFRDNQVTSAGGLYKIASSQRLKIATQTAGGEIAFHTASDTERLRITSTGSVGIGTVSPVSFSGQTSVTVQGTSVGRVDVLGAAGAGGGAITGSSTAFTISGNFNIPLGLTASSTAPITFTTGGTERMRITSTGSVGIGTSSPLAPLTLTKQGSITTEVRGRGVLSEIFNSVTGAAAEGFISSKARGSAASPVGLLNGDTVANYTAVGYDGTVWRPIGTLGWVAESVTDNTSIASAFIVQTGVATGNATAGTFTGTTERLRITSTGSVGIGTSSPDSVLHIASENNGTNTFTMESLDAFLSVAQEANAIEFQTNDGSATGVTGKIAQISENGNEDLALAFSTFNGTLNEAIRITSTGAVGIGTSSPATILHVSQAAGTAPEIRASAATVYIKLIADDAVEGLGKIDASLKLGFLVDGTERARIDSSGNLLVGTTSARTGTNSLTLEPANSFFMMRLVGTGAVTQVQFVRDTAGTPVVVGSISTTGTATSYVTSSDYRLKTDAQPMTGASARVQALKPVNFEWIADGTRVDGFLAHEAQAVVPEAVTGTKDAVDADGNPDYQGIDQSKLVPLLTAALQEALKRIEALEARITALEA